MPLIDCKLHIYRVILVTTTQDLSLNDRPFLTYFIKSQRYSRWLNQYYISSSVEYFSKRSDNCQNSDPDIRSMHALLKYIIWCWLLDNNTEFDIQQTAELQNMKCNTLISNSDNTLSVSQVNKSYLCYKIWLFEHISV